MGEAPCFNLPPGEPVIAYLGLGTNVGERGENLREALRRIARMAEIRKVSSVYETEPVGFRDQADFWNLVACIRTDLPAVQLMHALIGIEQDMGRERTFRNAPRIIDIDILLYDDVRLETGELQIPHPRLTERAFVLKPLVEIAPQLAIYAQALANGRFEHAEVVLPPIEVDPQAD